MGKRYSSYDALIDRATKLDSDELIVEELVEALKEVIQHNDELGYDLERARRREDHLECRLGELEEKLADLSFVLDDGSWPGTQACMEVALAHAEANYPPNGDEVRAIRGIMNKIRP